MFQKSSLTFGNAKAQVAAKAGKENTTIFLSRAGESIQQAVKYWNRYNWRWLMTQAATASEFASYASGATSISLPFDFKDVYSFRITSGGTDRPLTGIPRRLYDRMVRSASANGYLMGYDLFSQGSSNLLSLTPPPDTAGTYDLKYYRRMWVPCAISGVAGHINTLEGTVTGVNPTLSSTACGGATLGSWLTATATASGCYSRPTQIIGINESFTVSAYGGAGVNIGSPHLELLTGTASAFRPVATGNCVAATIGGDNYTLDIPEDYENGIIAWAIHHFLATLGAPDSRLAYFVKLANEELTEALKANEHYEDQDIAFALGDNTRDIRPGPVQ